MKKLIVNWKIPYNLCNYRCHYCPVPHTLNVEKEWLNRTVESLKRLPYMLGLVVETGGEPTISPALMGAFAELTSFQNVEFVNITSNIGLRREKLAEVLRKQDPAKFALDCTFHPTETSFDEFCGKISFLEELGFLTIVHYVAHPRAVRDIPYYVEELEKIGVRLTINALATRVDGKNAPEIYSADELALLKKYFFSEFQIRYDLMGESPLGKLCYSGAKSVLVDRQGGVYRCRIDRSVKLGTLADGFNLNDDATPCIKQLCRCPRDHLWLKEIDERIERTPCFRLYKQI